MTATANIAVFCKPFPSANRYVLSESLSWLRQKAYNILLDKETASLAGESSGLSSEEVSSQADMIIVLGGDIFILLRVL